MNFKQIVDSENRRLRNEVTQDEKIVFLANGKTYLFSKLMTEIQSLLDKDETVQGYLPLSTSGNLAISNQRDSWFVLCTYRKQSNMSHSSMILG